MRRHHVALTLLCAAAVAMAQTSTACIGADGSFPNDTFAMDFFGATLETNNLGAKGGMGSKDVYGLYNPVPGADHVIKYAGIGVYNGRSIDLVVSNLTAYKPNNPNNNGVNGQFGQINLGVRSEDMDNGGELNSGDVNSVRLKFEFMFGDTGLPAVISQFAFSFFDFDDEGFTDANGNIVGHECLKLASLRCTWFR